MALDRMIKGKQLLLPTHYVIKSSKYSFLKKDSVAKCEQITIVSLARLYGNPCFGKINDEDMNEIKKATEKLFK